MAPPRSRYPSKLDASSIEYAREQFKETPKKRQEYLKKLRQHFNDHEKPEFNITTEDEVLLAFLRSSKYNLPVAIDKLKNYYRMRSEMPSVFSDRDPRTQRIQEVLRLGTFVPLRKLQNGRLVLIVRVSVFDPSQYTLHEIFKVAYMILDVCNKICPQMQVHGVCAIFDLAGMSFAHARLTTPSIIKHMVKSWENYHCRPKQLEFINAPMFINVLLNVFRSFMKKKMKDRLRVHSGGNDSLLEILDPSVLPIEYGGEDGSIQEHATFWCDEITKHADWFLFDEQFKQTKIINT